MTMEKALYVGVMLCAISGTRKSIVPKLSDKKTKKKMDIVKASSDSADEVFVCLLHECSAKQQK